MSAAAHLLRHAQRDPRLAWLIGPGSQSWELITAEVAAARGITADALRSEVEASLRTEPWPSEGDIQQRIDDAVAEATGSPA